MNQTISKELCELRTEVKIIALRKYCTEGILGAKCALYSIRQVEVFIVAVVFLMWTSSMALLSQMKEEKRVVKGSHSLKSLMSVPLIYTQQN
jgi:hypothetical protein